MLSVEGGTAPFTWSVTGGALPPGLSMAPATGAVTGTPTTAGEYNFTVQVADSSDPSLTATQPHTITIAPGCATTTTAPTATTTTLPGTTTTLAPGITTTTIAGVAPVAPTTTIRRPTGTLPATGDENGSALYIGLALLALGSTMVIVTRRRASDS